MNTFYLKDKTKNTYTAIKQFFHFILNLFKNKVAANIN